MIRTSKVSDLRLRRKRSLQLNMMMMKINPLTEIAQLLGRGNPSKNLKSNKRF